MKRARFWLRFGVAAAFQACFLLGVLYYGDPRWVWLLMVLLGAQGWLTERHLWLVTLVTVAPVPAASLLAGAIDAFRSISPEWFLREFGVFYYFNALVMALAAWSYVGACSIPCYLGWFLRHRRFPAFDAPELISILQPGPVARRTPVRSVRLNFRVFDRYALRLALVRARD